MATPFPVLSTMVLSMVPCLLGRRQTYLLEELLMQMFPMFPVTRRWASVPMFLAETELLGVQ